MALLSDIRRVFRTQSRVRSMNRELSRLADSNALIAKALSIIVEREYGIDIYAPPVAVDSAEEMTVTYVNDREQAIREAREQLEMELAGTADERSELEKLLDEIG